MGSFGACTLGTSERPMTLLREHLERRQRRILQRAVIDEELQLDEQDNEAEFQSIAKREVEEEAFFASQGSLT